MYPIIQHFGFPVVIFIYLFFSNYFGEAQIYIYNYFFRQMFRNNTVLVFSELTYVQPLVSHCRGIYVDVAKYI